MHSIVKQLNVDNFLTIAWLNQFIQLHLPDHKTPFVMITTEVNFDEIKIKVKKLIHLHTDLRQENENLKEQNKELLNTTETLKNKITELENQNKLIKLGQVIKTGGTDQNSRNLKLKINEYIKEIDKCLAVLNK